MEECYFKKSCRLQCATLLEVTLLHRCFSRFLNSTNGPKSRNAPHLDVALLKICFFWVTITNFGERGRVWTVNVLYAMDSLNPQSLIHPLVPDVH